MTFHEGPFRTNVLADDMVPVQREAFYEHVEQFNDLLREVFTDIRDPLNQMYNITRSDDMKQKIRDLVKIFYTLMDFQNIISTAGFAARVELFRRALDKLVGIGARDVVSRHWFKTYFKDRYDLENVSEMQKYLYEIVSQYQPENDSSYDDPSQPYYVPPVDKLPKTETRSLSWPLPPVREKDSSVYFPDIFPKEEEEEEEIYQQDDDDDGIVMDTRIPDFRPPELIGVDTPPPPLDMKLRRKMPPQKPQFIPPGTFPPPPPNIPAYMQQPLPRTPIDRLKPNPGPKRGDGPATFGIWNVSNPYRPSLGAWSRSSWRDKPF